MIEAAVVLSAIVRHWAELAIVAVLLVVNAAIGFWEEYQAGNTIQALKAKLALRARVKRDGIWTNIAARELVPGDLIRVRLEDIIPGCWQPESAGADRYKRVMQRKGCRKTSVVI